MSVASSNSTKGTSPDERRSVVSAASYPPKSTQSSRWPSSRGWIVFPFVVCLLLLSGVIILGAMREAVGLPLFQSNARIRITPDVRTVQHSVVVLATSSAQPMGSTQIHLFTGKSGTKEGSTPATGDQSAQVAQGTLAFYNQSSLFQTVPAGTTYTGRDGIAVSIDALVSIPPWTVNGGMGSALVRAHAVSSGAGGNIAPGDVTICCKSDGLLIKNPSAFYGGRDAVTIVTSADIEKIKASQLPAQQQTAMRDLQKQMGSDERQLNAPTCQPLVHSNHPIGSSASTVQVTTVVTCAEQTYSFQEVHRLIVAAFPSIPAVNDLGKTYALQGQITVRMEQARVTPISQGAFSISVPARGIFVYQLNPQLIQQLIPQLAGASTKNARALLAHQPGVSSVTILVTGGWDTSTLPTNETHIEIVEVRPLV